MQNSAHTRLVLVNASGRRIGEDHPRAKLTDADIDLIFELREAGLSYRQIANKFDDIPGGLSKSAVFDILKGRRRAQVPAATKRVLVTAIARAYRVVPPDWFSPL